MIRIHKLASELGVKSKTLVIELNKQGIEVRSHMSSVDNETAELIREILTDGKKTGHKMSPAKKEANQEKTQKEITDSVPKPVNHADSPKIVINEGITLKELAEKIGCKTNELIMRFMKKGIMTTINQVLKIENANSIAKEFGFETETVSIDSDDIFADTIEKDTALSFPRHPVVTIMGHVDHGKTSLLDSIRETNVTDREAGGITQHIGAYKVKINNGEIVFLDTPGHEAFTAMRARGAQVTDIVVLVVAADDGVMPQTIEAIHHAEAAKVPIIVAINKIDKPNANPDNVKQMLSEYHLVPEEWGGTTLFAEVSAKSKIGIENMLELILLQAEMMELEAPKDIHARGFVIEAKLDKGRGVVATVLVQKGTLKIGDMIITGIHSGKVRALVDDKGNTLESAGPSTPVEVLGLSTTPEAGDTFLVVTDDRKVKQILNKRQEKQRIADLSKSTKITLEDLYSQINLGAIKELNMIVKADVQGSLQAVSDSLMKLNTPDVRINIIHGSVGGIKESDVMLASASNALILGFSVRPAEVITELAKKEQVDINLYTVIYHAIADIKNAMEGLLDPTLKEKTIGRAEVRELFTIPKIGVIAGCYVLNGAIKRNSNSRIVRDSVVVYEGKIASLRRFKNDVKEVASGYECGIGIEKFNDLKEGDIIEPFELEKIIRRL